MYNESYDEYIRSILGYPSFNNGSYENEYEYESFYNSRTDELEKFYPEIYRIVYPMVTKVCENCREPFSREAIENMTDEIFNSIEANNELIQRENRNTSSNAKEPLNKNSKTENRGEDRQFRNRNLRDLIQILIIRELLRRNFQGQRPRPPRPPFPPGGPGRPPFPERTWWAKS